MAEENTTTATTEAPAEGAAETTQQEGQAADQQPGSDLSPLDWHSSLVPELQRNPTLAQYKSINDVAKALVETKALVGSSIRLPTETDTPEVANEKMQEVYAKLGRPEKPTEYKMPEDLEYPDNFQPFGDDSTLLEAARQGAFEEGLNQKQFDFFMKLNAQQWREVVNQAEADRAAAGVKGRNELAAMHGAATPTVMSRAQHVVELLGSGAFGGTEAGAKAWEAIEQAGLHNNPALVTALANIASRMSEGPYHAADDFSAGMQTPADVDAKIQQLMSKQQNGGLTAEENRQLDSLYEAKVRIRESQRVGI